MDPQYKINDSRFLNDFKDKTFSGYKKCEVINTLFKNIDKNIAIIRAPFQLLFIAIAYWDSR